MTARERQEPTLWDGPGGSANDPELALLAQHFRDFADFTASKLPLYRRLADAAADDRDVLARLLLADPDQRFPNLLFAAVHDLLLSGEEDELAAWYGSLTQPVRPVGTGDDDPWPHFRRLALEDPHVARRLRTGSTQTNEVGRCVALLPALAGVAASAPDAPPDGGVRPLGLVEVGASAGLNLLLDHYSYRYEPGDHRVGAPSALTLTCKLRGEGRPPLPSEPLPIASRIGLDRHPVNLADRAQARWLVACQWPDQPERVHRARIAIALAHGDAPPLVEGDAVDDLAPLVEGVSRLALPVVISTWVLSYLLVDRQRALVSELDRLGASRDLSMVFAEEPSRVPGMPIPPRPDGRANGPATALVRLDWRGGTRSEVRLADMHPHGTWLEWLAD